VKICVIFNPTARGDKARRFLPKISRLGNDAEFWPTSCAGSATILTRQAVLSGFDTIVAAGGDGTVNEVINGLAAEPEQLRNVCLGILPMGTINVFARELGLPRSMDGAWSVITHGCCIEMDLPYVDYFKGGEPRRKYFAQLAGAGLDARAIELVNWELKKKFGPAAYVLAGFSALRRCQGEIDVSNGTTTVSGELALIGNGSLYGGSFKILSPAHLQDGLFTACVFKKVGLKSLASFAGWSLRQKGQIPGGHYIQGKTITLASSERIPLEVDGDAIGHLPARFAMSEEKLRVLIPPDGSKFSSSASASAR